MSNLLSLQGGGTSLAGRVFRDILLQEVYLVQPSVICFVVCNEEFSQLLSILNFQLPLALARLVGCVHLFPVSAWLLACPHALAAVQCDLR